VHGIHCILSKRRQNTAKYMSGGDVSLALDLHTSFLTGAILGDTLPVLNVIFEALDGCLHGILEACLLDAIRMHFCQQPVIT